MADEERLLVSLEARINDFEKKMARAEKRGTRTYNGLQSRSRSATRNMERDMSRATSSINRSLSTASTRIGTLGKTMVTGLAVGAVTAGLSRITTGLNQTVKGIAEVANQAEMAGVSIEAFQELQYVAEQNRIGVDALVDGLKELNLRADEFVETGKGPAAESFRRLGFGADELSRKLEDPRELLLEIIGRLGDMERAAQLRIADEVFGGQAGERFVTLVRQGEDALRDTVDEARNVGAVMDKEMIEKAEELDRKFSLLSKRVSNFGKQVAVSLANLPVDVVQRQIYELFDSEAQGRSILGDQLYDQLEEAGKVAQEQADEINKLTGEYQRLDDQANSTSAALMRTIMQLNAWGYTDAATAIASSARDMRSLAGQFAEGEITAGQFADKLGDVQGKADDAFASLKEMDKARFSGARSSVDALGRSLASIVGLAAQVRSALSGLGDGGGSQGADGGAKFREQIRNQTSMISEGMAREDFVESESARNARSRAQVALSREVERVRGRAEDAGTEITDAQATRLAEAAIGAEERRRRLAQSSGGGASGGSGGGTAERSELEQEIEAIREETRALETESTALTRAARTGEDYGRALEMARAKAELLNAAQRDGMEITPQLRNQVDELATSYTDAGQGLDTIREKLDRARQAQEDFRSSAESAFTGLVTGAQSFSEALSGVLTRLAEMAASRAFRAIWPEGTSVGGGKGGLFGGNIIPGILHDGGVAGRHGYGHGRSVPAAAFAGAPRYHSGGVAGMKPDEVPAVLQKGERVLPKDQTGARAATARVEVKLSPDLEARILQQSGAQAVRVTQQSMEDYDRDVLPESVEHIRQDPARRG